MGGLKELRKKIENNQLFKKGIKDTGFYALSILLGRALTILIIPYLATQFSLEEIGNYDLFLIGTNYIQLFLTLGIDSGVAIKIADNLDDFQKLRFYFSISLLVVFAMTLLMVAIAVPVYFIFKEYPITFLVLLVIQGFLMAIQYIAYNYFKWMGQSKRASILMSIGYSMGIIIGVICIKVLASTLTMFLLGIVMGNVIGVIITLIISYPYISFTFKSEEIKEVKSLLQLSIPFFFNSLLNQSYKAADRFIILYFLNSHILGVYSLVIRICQIPVMGIEVALNAFQAITFVNYKTKEGIDLYNKILKLNFKTLNVLILLFSLGLTVIIPYVPGLIAIKDYVYLIPFVFLNISYISIKMYGGFSYYIHNKTIYVTYITLISLLVYVISAAIFSKYGIMGIVVSAALTSVLSTYAFYYLSNRIQSFNEKMVKIFIYCSLGFSLAMVLTLLLKNT